MWALTPGSSLTLRICFSWTGEGGTLQQCFSNWDMPESHLESLLKHIPPSPSEILIQEVWGRDCESAFLAGSQVLLLWWPEHFTAGRGRAPGEMLDWSTTSNTFVSNHQHIHRLQKNALLLPGTGGFWEIESAANCLCSFYLHIVALLPVELLALSYQRSLDFVHEYLEKYVWGFWDHPKTMYFQCWLVPCNRLSACCTCQGGHCGWKDERTQDFPWGCAVLWGWETCEREVTIQDDM